MLLGHSKGGVDAAAAAALSIYLCDLKDKVAGLALVQSPYGGTPLAYDILRGQIADKETHRIMELLICKLIKVIAPIPDLVEKGDIRAMEDLTYEKQKEFIMKHKLPFEQIPLVSFHSEASIAPSWAGQGGPRRVWAALGRYVCHFPGLGSAEPQAVSGLCRLSFFDCKLLSDIFITFCFDDELVKFRFEELIGDVYIENEISEMPLAAYNDTVGSASLLFDSLGFYSSMDDIFTRLLTLASYISRRFIQFIEDLAVRDADRYSDLLVDTTITRFTICLEIGNFLLEKFCRKTLQGSSDDIGWLPRTPGMLGVEDSTARFLELLAGIRNGEHTLPSSFVYLLIPGLYSNHGPLYFVGTKKFFSKMGLACHIAKIHSEASVEHNAWELKQYIEELYWGSSKRVMLLGHSKGGVDAAAALSIYLCDLKDKVAGLALGDIRALEDLTYEKQKEFIMKHKLPYEQIPLATFHSEASIAPYKEYSRAATL
ncbi:unnamed protein product [Prunus armeniaca]|uniref:Uncharacterized protein n=1 Tax=Prunus armeniaca TaxID=36596 RepID=A0A6J5VIK5_PRUAR|nr:unnamed protein product [Prunus armeniaca]